MQTRLAESPRRWSLSVSDVRGRLHSYKSNARLTPVALITEARRVALER